MLEILYEDNHLIAINKKSGDIAQADKTGDPPISSAIKTYIKRKYNKKGEVFLGTIHRLDRPTSGVVIYAKTSKALKRMNELFRKREVKKTYWAIVEKCPPKENDRIEDFLKKNPKQNKSYITNNKTGKQAILYYRIIKKLKNYYMLEVKPETGRHHQIRAQLANIGCIIKGDLKYGARRSNKNASISLLARRIEFIHPVKKEKLEIISPIKDDIW